MSIRRELYQLDYYTEGTIPDMIVTVPKEWTPNQVNEFQATFDFLLEGNAALKSKVRFMPGDMKPSRDQAAHSEERSTTKVAGAHPLLRFLNSTHGVRPDDEPGNGRDLARGSHRGRLDAL